MVAAQQGTNRSKNFFMTGLGSEEDEDVAGQTAGGDRVDVVVLPESLFEVVFEPLRPTKPMDLIATSPSNSLMKDSYHGSILHAGTR
jgi:hypothetical protein